MDANKQFEKINTALQDESKRENALKVKKSFEFVVKDDKYFIDLKDGKAGKGSAPGKADVTLTVDEETLLKLFDGSANAQKLFMTGKIKIKGNMMLATKLGPVLEQLLDQPAKSKL